MGRQISQDRLISTIIQGVEKAQRFYEEASGGDCWLWEGPEYLLDVFVAQAIHKLEGEKYCTLETNVHQTLKDAQAITLGAPPKKLRHKGRFDLVVWWANGYPRAALEFKNQVESFAQISRDVDRVEGVVERNSENSSFQFGAIVFYTSCIENSKSDKTAREILEDRMEKLKIKTIDHVSKRTKVQSHCGSIHTVEDSAWCAVCITLRR